jgi:hypothetical protein
MPGPVSLAVRYAVGDGVLLGAGSRWLLIDVTDADDPFLETLWDLLTAPVPASERVLAAVEEHYGTERSLVLVDLTPGAETTVSRGSGRVTRADGVRQLRLGDGSPSPTRRLVSGIVAAAGAELTPVAAPARAVAAGPPAPAPVAGLIDGIPPDILSSTAPERTPVVPSSVTTGEPVAPPTGTANRRLDDRVGGHTVRRTTDTDHDGHTTYRPDGTGPDTPEPVDAEPVDHLRQSTHETVLAVHCPAGHTTQAFTANCRVCNVAVPPREPHRMPRPRLGVLHLPDGKQVALDRGVVFGRQPSAPPAGEDWPQLVRLPPDNTYVSRSHLQVELDGWLVLATDLGSRGGTTLRVPGRAPERIRAGERYIWEPGQVFDLADSYEILYEVI